MTPSERFAPILIRLLEAMVDQPDLVKISTDEFVGGINWGFECGPDDVRKVIGKQGSRLRALRLIVDLAGKEAREEWRIYAPAPTGRITTQSFKAEKPTGFTPVASMSLLNDLLTLVGVDAGIEGKGNSEDGYAFRICPIDAEGKTTLLEMHPALYSDNQVETQPINLIGSLGTVFRGIAGKNGVKFHLDVI